MTVRALREDDTAAMEGKEIRSWADGYPCDEQNDPSGLSSGVKDVTPDDTMEQTDSPPEARRRTGPRKRIELKADTVRDALERRYRQEGLWDDLVDLYLGQVEVVDDPEKVELFKRLGEVLWHELGDATASRDAFIEALALDPDDDDAASHLADIAASRDGGWTALTEAVADKIAVVRSNPVRARLAERVVRWARGDMNAPETAERFFNEIRIYDPTHPLIHQRQARAYADAGAWDSQREALERALSRSRKPLDRWALHVALGRLHEDRIPNPRLAQDHYEKALAIDPRTLVALSGLERIFRAAEQYGRLAEILDHEVDAASTEQDRVGALLRLGELVEQRFLKPGEAVAKYEVALELNPDCGRALDGLERCWYALRDWEKLAGILERRAAEATETGEAIAALVRLAEVRESKQQDVDSALAAWRRIYELDTSHLGAIHELARLCERQGDVTASAAYRARLADLTDDPREKARIHVAVGEMLFPEDRDPACARIHFERAVEMDPRSAPAWENLQKLAERDGDAMYATFCLERRAENTDSDRVKAQLLIELGRMRASLGDTRGALATFEYAFQTDRTNETAARAVVEEWARAERWSEAQDACDVLVAAATRDGDRATLLKLLRLSTRTALALGNGERAMMAAGAAHDLDPADTGARDDLLHVCHELRDRTDLGDRVGPLAERLAAAAMDLRPDALVRLGEVRLAVGDRHGGVELLYLAIARQGDNTAALTVLSRVFLEGRDWGRAANCTHRLARALKEPKESRAAFVQAADLWEKHAHAPARAATVLEEALERDPTDVGILHRLVALRGELGEWELLVEALAALSALERDPMRRAKHAYASASVVREKIGDARRAARLYEEVLDLDETRLEAFERLVRLWTDLRDWPELEQSYRRMVGRVHDSDNKDLLRALHHQLGLLYRDRIGDYALALEAFQRATRVAPEDEEDRRIVVELLVLTGQPEAAVADLRGQLRSDATRPSTFRELYELFLRQGRNDEAWCAANALVHLGEADEAQHKFVQDFPPVKLSDVTGTLAACAWGSHLVAPGLDVRLTAVFRCFVPAVVRARMARVPEKNRVGWLGARIRETESLQAGALVRLVRDVTEILGIAPPLLLSRPKLSVPFAVAPTPTPALFVSLPAVEGVPGELLPFLLGRRLAQLRPELMAHALFPTLPELKALLETALRVAIATRRAPPRAPDEAAIARALEPHELEGLREAVSAIVGTEARADIRRWYEQADVSLSRAGMLLTGDFDLAWRAMQREPRSPSELTPSEWRAEMLQFLVSRAHADLRDAIGVSVDAR